MKLFDQLFRLGKGKEKEQERIAKRPQLEESTDIKKYHLNYQLSYEELAESMTLICDRRSKKSRIIMSCVLFVLAIGAVILYAQNPYGIHYAFTAIVMAAFSFIVGAYPSLKGKNSARKISKQRGTYKLVVSSDGYILPYGDDSVDLFAFSGGKCFETNQLFAIRADRFHSFCIPKRILNPIQLFEIRAILVKYCPAYTNSCHCK